MDALLTPEQIHQVLAMVDQVAGSPAGNGQVIIVIHNGRPRFITVSMNLDLVQSKQKTPE